MGIKITNSILHDIARPVVVAAGKMLDKNGVYITTIDGCRVFLLKTGKYVKIVESQAEEIPVDVLDEQVIVEALQAALTSSIRSREQAIRRMRRAQAELVKPEISQISITLA